MVNMLVVSPWVFVAKPFGPRDGQRDVFENYVSAEFADKLPGTGVRFLDDWNTYHRWAGEIHCGTNAKRTPPPDVKWWE